MHHLPELRGKSVSWDCLFSKGQVRKVGGLSFYFHFMDEETETALSCSYRDWGGKILKVINGFHIYMKQSRQVTDHKAQ